MRVVTHHQVRVEHIPRIVEAFREVCAEVMQQEGSEARASKKIKFPTVTAMGGAGGQ